MNVFQVEAEVRNECIGQSFDQLVEALANMGVDVDVNTVTRDELVQKLVDLEVYAFTH